MHCKSNESIVGIGTDMVDVRRIEAAFARHGERFTHRIYTEAERSYCENASNAKRRMLRYANRFAAKESAYKALNVGRGAHIAWQELEVMHLPSGAPSVLFHGNAHEAGQWLLPNASASLITHLSLSDEYPYSIAFVVLSARLIL